MYALRGGFLVRPLVIAVLLGVIGATLSSLEEQIPAVSEWLPVTLFPSHQDPQMAQVILGGIAGSIMTVVSIVFAILLMTLTLASTQFSPRILVNFVRDRTTQWTLGVFLGTFSYCIAALPAARTLPQPFAPVATVAGAMVLALLCVAWLIFFINHISQSVSVNHIIDRIAREAELVIDDLMPLQRTPFYQQDQAPVPVIEGEVAIMNETSGYVQFDRSSKQLLQLARTHGIRVRVLRRVGHFIPAGIPLLLVSRTDQHMTSSGSCRAPSTSVPRAPCSRTSNSASSRLLTSRCVPFRPRSTIRARRSGHRPAFGHRSAGSAVRRRHRGSIIRRMCCEWCCPGSI